MVMTLEDVAETYPDLLYMDEFKEALMGVVERIGTVSLCYDQDKIIEILMRDMTEEEAIEHFNFNVVGGWVGEHTPFTFIRIEEE